MSAPCFYVVPNLCPQCLFWQIGSCSLGQAVPLQSSMLLAESILHSRFLCLRVMPAAGCRSCMKNAVLLCSQPRCPTLGLNPSASQMSPPSSRAGHRSVPDGTLMHQHRFHHIHDRPLSCFVSCKAFLCQHLAHLVIISRMLAHTTVQFQ